MHKLDDIDQKIIEATQDGLPLTTEPYQTVADGIGMSAQVVKQRMINMQQTGMIRRIAAVPNHYKLGYVYNGMTVWDIADEHIDKLGKKVGQLVFVSHCYHRPRHLPEWPYNLFAMVHSKTQDGVEHQVKQIANLLGEFNRGNCVLYSTKILKKTGLRLKR